MKTLKQIRDLAIEVYDNVTTTANYADTEGKILFITVLSNGNEKTLEEYLPEYKLINKNIIPISEGYDKLYTWTYKKIK